MPMVRFRCSYGGRIIPGSHEKSSHYIGGVTRVVFIERVSSLSDFRTLLFKALFPGTLIDGCCLSIKYLLPGKDPDRLISVTTDQDLHEMYQANSKLQLFLFLLDEDGDEYDLEWNECVSDTGMEDDMEYDMEDDMKEYEQKELERGQKEEKLNDFQGFNNIAYAMLEAFVHQGITKARETFQIVSPGSNIPKWFRHRRVGDSLTVPLPSHSNNNRFIGFALCAVFVLHEHHRVDELNIYQFKTFNATHHLVCCLKLNGRKLEVRGRQPAFRFSEEFCQIESDHLWLFYVSCDKYFGREWQNSRSKIEFLFQTRGPGLKVKKCGVHFIYGQDVGGLNLTMTQPSRWIAPHEHLIDFQKI
ncbi:hypothetical protein M0R45_025595 [Rubus argutus]|uniref:PB1 domain-containing protein n=1 Tax=Rubus argutus TaxID=59490 RepID=A0AAW1WWW9_RUBAR